MKVNRKRYAKKPDRSHALMVNIRLRKTGSKPTRAEVEKTLKHILNTGQVPDGWQFAAIDWRRPQEASVNWRQGDVSDIQNLEAIILAMLPTARIGVVRK